MVMSQCHDSYETDPLKAARYPVLVRDVMTSTPISIEPTATVKDIAHTMLAHDVRFVPVMDVGGTLVGVVSESDVICRECPTARHHALAGFVDRMFRHDHAWMDKSEGITAEEIMTTDIVSCTPTEPAMVVARRLLSEDLRVLPVIDHGQLVGVVSRHDVLRLLDRPDPEIRGRIERLLASPLWAPEGHHVEFKVADGIVGLSGTVRFPSDAEVVVSEISRLPGVISVENHLSAENPEPRSSLLRDTDWR
jgi:CBS domain-containing protein